MAPSDSQAPMSPSPHGSNAPPTGVPIRLTWYLGLLLVALPLAGFFDSFATTFRYTMITYVRRDFGISFSEMVDMFKAGIIDATKVVRTALQNAGSIAGLMLTTDTLVTTVDDRPAVEGAIK